MSDTSVYSPPAPARQLTPPPAATSPDADQVATLLNIAGWVLFVLSLLVLAEATESSGGYSEDSSYSNLGGVIGLTAARGFISSFLLWGFARLIQHAAATRYYLRRMDLRTVASKETQG